MASAQELLQRLQEIMVEAAQIIAELQRQQGEATAVAPPVFLLPHPMSQYVHLLPAILVLMVPRLLVRLSLQDVRSCVACAAATTAQWLPRFTRTTGAICVTLRDRRPEAGTRNAS